MNWTDMYDTLHLNVGVSKEALDLAFGLNGCSEETACDILRYYTGYNDFDQYFDYESDDEEDCLDELFNLDEGFDPYAGCYTYDC